MRPQMNSQKVDKSKVIAITLLTILSVLIALSGIVFGIVSALHGISYTVFNTPVPGLVFGLVICFLGIRYLISVQNLKQEVYKTTSEFSWLNFQK